MGGTVLGVDGACPDSIIGGAEDGPVTIGLDCIGALIGDIGGIALAWGGGGSAGGPGGPGCTTLCGNCSGFEGNGPLSCANTLLPGVRAALILFNCCARAASYFPLLMSAISLSIN